MHTQTIHFPSQILSSDAHSNNPLPITSPTYPKATRGLLLTFAKGRKGTVREPSELLVFCSFSQ